METDPVQHLGEPSLEIAGFRRWIQSRQYPDSSDYYDGNWLNVTAYCSSKGSNSLVSGPILTTTDVERFFTQVQRLYSEPPGEAALESFEPELRVLLRTVDALGHIQMIVNITPDNTSQKHEYKFQIDRSYLPSVLTQCRKILDEFPVMGQPPTE